MLTMRVKRLIVIIINIIIILLCGIFIEYNYKFIGNIDSTNINSTTSTVSIQLSISDSPISNTILVIPPDDYVINHINWSLYPNLEKGYIYMAQIIGPTDTIPHKFIEVQILTEVTDTSDLTLIRSELSGVAYEVRDIYGPNSDIHILGTKDGAATWDITLYPYENNAH